MSALPIRGSFWRPLNVTLIALAAIPGALGQTYRTDLPDNGFRFLPLDAQKIIPSSLPLVASIDGQIGNPRLLKASMIALTALLIVAAISFSFFSWKRRQKDLEMYEKVYQSYQARREMRARSAIATAQLEEKNVGGQEWTCIQITPERVRTPEAKVGNTIDFNEKQGCEKPNIPPEIRSNQPNSTNEPTRLSSIPVHAKSQSKVPKPSSHESHHPMTSERPKPLAPALVSANRPKSPIDDTPLGENAGFRDDDSTPKVRKIKLDSIMLYCDKKRKAGGESDSTVV